MKIQPEYSDEELLQMICGSEKDCDKAIRYLVEDKAVKKTLLHLTDNENDVNEAITEGAMHLYLNVVNGKFMAKSSLRSYFIQICKYTMLNRIRKSNKEVSTDMISDTSHFDTSGADEYVNQGEHLALMDKRDAALRQLIDSLRAGCKEALEQYYWQQKGYEALTQALRLKNAHQARKKISECRKQLSAMINDNPDLHRFLKATL